MKITLLVSLLIVVSAGADTLFARSELKDGQNPSYTLGYCTSEGLEAWAFALPSFPIYEIGYSKYLPIGKESAVLVGGYASYWSKLDQWYAEPIVIGFTQIGDWRLKSFWGAYMPLDGGAWQLFNESTKITTPISSTLDVGVVGTSWFTEGTKPTFGFGPTGSLKVGDLTLSARALIGVNQANSLRMEVVCPF